MAKTKKKKNNKILWILLSVFVVLLAVLIITQKNKKKETEVDLAKPKRTTIVEKISASGLVQPVRELRLSPDVAGEIIELTVKEGDSVYQDMLLVKIRPDNYISAVQRAEASLSQTEANLESARANLARAKATYDRARQDLERSETLYKQEVISTSDWELAQQTYKVAENDYKSASASVEAAGHVVKSSRAGLADAKENLRKTSVFSPINGTVSKLDVEQGERVVGTSQFAGTEMMRIANLNEMEVRVDVNENDIIRISKGDTAIIDVDSYALLDKTFKGVVTQIANTAQPKTSPDAVTEFEVRIRILEESFRELQKEGYKNPFKPGMTASVDIITMTKSDILTVPLAAVTTRTRGDMKKLAEKAEGEEGEEKSEEAPTASTSEEDEETVEVIFVNAGGVAKLREVETGISDYENIEIVSALNDTTEVVTGPFIAITKTLKDGDNIKSKEKGDDDKEESDE